MFIQKIIYLKKNGGYVINLDEYKSIGTHWIALHVNGDNVTYFVGFRVEYIPKKCIDSFFSNICVDNLSFEFINVILKGKSLLDYTNLFSLN